MINKITGAEIYKSPTDMGVNSIGNCIVNDETIKEGSEAVIVEINGNKLYVKSK